MHDASSRTQPMLAQCPYVHLHCFFVVITAPPCGVIVAPPCVGEDAITSMKERCFQTKHA